jgi:type II secretory pathway predicted ATPase ExeA
LTRETTELYIQHRLGVAGCSKSIFTDAAYQLIFDYARGIPRLINTICDNAMLEGYLMKREMIDVDIVEQVARDLGLKRMSV